MLLSIIVEFNETRKFASNGSFEYDFIIIFTTMSKPTTPLPTTTPPPTKTTTKTTLSPLSSKISNETTKPTTTTKSLSLKQIFTPTEIKQMYDTLMIPNFPVRDELDPLEAWLEANDTDVNAWKKKEWARRFFAMVDENNTKVVGLCVVETFAPSVTATTKPEEAIPTALLAYLVVDSVYRGKGISKTLVQMASRDHPVLFLETETIPKEIGKERTERGGRMNIHKKNGFASIEKFHYVQPPCAPDQGP
jgi:hypothetical protein